MIEVIRVIQEENKIFLTELGSVDFKFPFGDLFCRLPP